MSAKSRDITKEVDWRTDVTAKKHKVVSDSLVSAIKGAIDVPKLYNVQTGELLGVVSVSDIQALIDQLEEEHRTDNDYFINPTTIDLLSEAGTS